MRFLIDECLSPHLAAVAHGRGFEAYHVAHRRWSGLKDHELLRQMALEELTLVTNNRDDFLALISGLELHPGLIVILENAKREAQVSMFAAALDAIGVLPSLINKVAEVSGAGAVTIYDLPPP